MFCSDAGAWGCEPVLPVEAGAPAEELRVALICAWAHTLSAGAAPSRSSGSRRRKEVSRQGRGFASRFTAWSALCTADSLSMQ